MRERQVVAALAAGHRTVEAIAESIYDGLEPGLMPAARENVRAHLEKLAADGRRGRSAMAGACCDRLRVRSDRHMDNMTRSSISSTSTAIAISTS